MAIKIGGDELFTEIEISYKLQLVSFLDVLAIWIGGDELFTEIEVSYNWYHSSTCWLSG